MSENVPSDDPEYIPPAPGGTPSPEGGNPATPPQPDANYPAGGTGAGGLGRIEGEQAPPAELPTETPPASEPPADS